MKNDRIFILIDPNIKILEISKNKTVMTQVSIRNVLIQVSYMREGNCAELDIVFHGLAQEVMVDSQFEITCLTDILIFYAGHRPKFGIIL